MGGSAIVNAQELKSAISQVRQRYTGGASEVEIGRGHCARSRRDLSARSGDEVRARRIRDPSPQVTRTAPTAANVTSIRHGKVEIGLRDVEDVGRIVNPLTEHGQAVGPCAEFGRDVASISYDDEGQFLAGTSRIILLPVDFPTCGRSC